MYNVLVFPCGSQPAIDLNFALRHSVEVRLFGASSVDDHGRFVYKNYIEGLPNISDENFLTVFQAVLEKYHIDFVIPTHDTVALFLVENQNVLRATVIAPDLDTVRVCRSKSLTYQLFNKFPFAPKTYNTIEDIFDYPVFIKPDNGQGGKDAFIARNPTELKIYAQSIPSPVITEFLPGDELTVDCFTDRYRTLRFVGPRTRERTLAGISVRSKVIPMTQEIYQIANSINDRLSFRGYWFFQIKRSKSGEYKLLEISSRMAGTACLNISRGVNFPLLSILDRAGLDVEVLSNDFDIEIDRSLINRYVVKFRYDRVYIDLDDTLLVNGQVNVYVMMFLYQCINQNKDIVLLTNHQGNILESLHRHRIDSRLFTEIIQLSSHSNKYHYIRDDKPAIFIDNSFNERQEVYQRLGIPVFDVNSIDVLIDWRE